MAATVVRALKTEGKCKLCKHPKRAEIDALLLRRSNRERTEDGRNINLEFVLARLSEWEVVNPNLDNVKLHWTKHCEVISAEVAAAQKHSLAEMVEQLTPDRIAQMTEADWVRWTAQVGLAQESARIQTDGTTSITMDHVLRAAAELRQRKSDETIGRLLGELGGGITAALSQAKEPKQIGEAEVIDQEPVEVPS